jgi:ABC-2 type transport system ATP-binding protein
MITIRNLVAGYGDHLVIDRLNLTLESGMIHGLIGLNGSGKTTLFKCISGIMKARSGEVLLEERALTRKHVSFLETEPYFYHGITGREYMDLFKNHLVTDFNTSDWAKLFNVPLDELIDFYSTGMKKKLALMGVIKSGRKLMLLDEPFNGLDLESTRILSAVLPRLIRDGRTIIITSHILDALKNICSGFYYLASGSVQRSFSTNEVDLIEQFIFTDLDKEMQDKIKKLTI